MDESPLVLCLITQMPFVDHVPLYSGASDCLKCGKPRTSHRVDHIFASDGFGRCLKCGLPAENHRVRSDEYMDRKKTKNNKRKHSKGTKKKRSGPKLYIGIDGEGQGRRKHRYVMLAAADKDGKTKWWIIDKKGLSTERCLDFMLNLPDNAMISGFAFNYDLTKILTDLPDEQLWLLFRPEQRPAPLGKMEFMGPRPIYWVAPSGVTYSLNLQGSKFTLQRRIGGEVFKQIIWDTFKFYQSKFTVALKDWKVGDPEVLKRMVHMKDQRADFDKLGREEIKQYCLEECQYMGELTYRLVTAHNDVGLKLKNFYGAGSSGAAILDKMGIRQRVAGSTYPQEMNHAVASAFFGGRFENSVIGQVNQRVFSFDISSAYPYHITFLPCLEHGEWKLTKNIEVARHARAACVHYYFRDNPHTRNLRSVKQQGWGPFPFRERSGSISYPSYSGGGWVWQEEFFEGLRLFPEIGFREAWVYKQDCECKPFEAIPKYYCQRCKIGKEGPGIVIKLGCNSCYGKLAQSVGRPVFNNWIWAGMIPSGCRAQVLTVLGLHDDWRNMLMVATDGVQSLEDIKTPAPKDTGSGHPITDESTGKTSVKPLGGWERKQIDKGVFYARPGIYFPMSPTKDELKEVRGRGVGKAVVLENWQMIVDSYEKYGLDRPIKVCNVTRFNGAKSSISRAGNPRDGYEYTRAPRYGQWTTREVEMSFNPMPKRAGITDDGHTLRLRYFRGDLESQPYKKAVISEEAREMMRSQLEVIEQPDVDMSDYEEDL